MHRSLKLIPFMLLVHSFSFPKLPLLDLKRWFYGLAIGQLSFNYGRDGQWFKYTALILMTTSDYLFWWFVNDPLTRTSLLTVVSFLDEKSLNNWSNVEENLTAVDEWNEAYDIFLTFEECRSRRPQVLKLAYTEVNWPTHGVNSPTHLKLLSML